MKTVRFIVRDGRLEPLEPVALVEGSEVLATVEVAETAAKKAKLELPVWNLGVMGPLTREEIYEDVC
jgi:predicted DNA-binding antitoxin AbrB/MazE fold protein